MNIKMYRERVPWIAVQDCLERLDGLYRVRPRRVAIGPIIPRHRIHPGFGEHRGDVVIAGILGVELA